MKKVCLNCGSDYLNYWDNKIECCACGNVVTIDDNIQNKQTISKESAKKSECKDLSSYNDTNGNKKK